MTITVADVYRWMETAPRDRMNPMSERRACIYTDEKGNHCIAGQFATERGLRLPSVESNFNSTSVLSVAFDYDWDIDADAADLLRRLQYEADMFTEWGRPDAWGAAIDAVTEGRQS